MSDTTKFVVTKGIANEYYITIKQNGTALPMEIITGTDAVVTTTNVVTPTYNVIPAVAYRAAIPEVPYVAPVAGQSYIPAVAGLPEVYKITAYTLDSGDNDVGVTYNVAIDNVTFPKLYKKATYTDIYKYFEAIAVDINAHAVIGAKVTATVDASALIITGDQVGVSFTVNASGALYVAETQTAVVPVAGQAFIAAVPEQLYVAAVPEVQAQPEKYVRTLQTHQIEIVDPHAGRYARDTQISVVGTGVHIKVNGVEVMPVNGVYDINTNLTFSVVLDAVAESTAVPADVVITATTTYTVTQDTFNVYVYELATGTKVATLTQVGTTDGQVSVHDRVNGKLKVVMSEALTNRLTAVRGDRADYYYSKPVYKIVVDASTVNNGEFIATIDKVYVA